MQGILGVSRKENPAAPELSDRLSIDFCRRRHGRPTAFIAETYGRLTGEPGVCISALAAGVQSFCFISRLCSERRI